MSTKHASPFHTVSADTLLQNYENLVTQRSAMNLEMVNLDRQILEARTQLKAAMVSTTKSNTTFTNGAKPKPVSTKTSAPNFKDLDSRVQKSMNPLLKHFPAERGEFRAADVEKALHISRGSAFFRLQRGIELGFYSKVSPGVYVRTPS